MAAHNELGKKGEGIAVEYLVLNGYEIIEKNYRWRGIEIDIIATKDHQLCFIEVKTRSTDYYGIPESFVDRKKQKKYIKAADMFIHRNRREEEAHFDIIGIVISKDTVEIQHTKEAFSIIVQ